MGQALPRQPVLSSLGAPRQVAGAHLVAAKGL